MDEKKNILLFPCSGVEKLTGQLSTLIAAEVMERGSIPQLKMVPSFAQLGADLDGMQQHAEQSKIIAINGCASKCVSKFLETRNLPVYTSIFVAPLLKGTGYKPTLQNKLTQTDLSILPAAADNLIEKLQGLLQESEKDPGGSNVAESLQDFSFNPKYSKYLEYRSGKFLFRVPDAQEKLYFTWNDIWAFLVGDLMIIGASDYLQKNLSDIMFVDLPEVGQPVEYLDEIVLLESAKTMNEVLAPCSGKIVLTNEALLDAPELINEDPYNQGWLCVIQTNQATALEEFQENLRDLLKPAEYFETMKKKIDEYEE